MFCPKCGKAEQLPETYCRQCGVFLPDLSKPVKRENQPEEHLKANTVLSLMTIVTCFTLATLLYVFFGFRSGTHPMIYATAGLLIAMGGWHIQTFIRTRMLKKQIEKLKPKRANEAPAQSEFNRVETGKLLDEADFANVIPASVTESTTRLLVDEPGRDSSQTKH